MTYQSRTEEPKEIIVGVADMVRMSGSDGLDVFGLFAGGSGGGIVCIVGLDRGRGDGG
jgi:hypothetical protein